MPSWLPFLLVALACPVAMGLMMWVMMRNMRGHQDEAAVAPAGALSPEARLAGLEAEKQALEQQIAVARENWQPVPQQERSGTVSS